MSRAIVWFKTDLRLHDNEVLAQAIEYNDEVIPVFCFDTAHFTTTSFGFEKTGSYRLKFIMEALTDLNASLRKAGSGLLVVSGKPHEQIAALALQYNATAVYAKQEVGWEELQEERRLMVALQPMQVAFKTYNTSTLYPYSELPFALANTPDIFTDFRKQVERQSEVPVALSAPQNIPGALLPPMQLPTFASLGVAYLQPDTRSAITFIGGETEGLQRLQYYLFDSKKISKYKDTRNGMVGEGYSSKFSAWLAQGCLSPRKIYHEIKSYEADHGANESTYWLVFELLWREYFRLVMEKYGTRLFMPGGIKSTAKNFKKENPHLLHKWINGTIGNNFVDANMLELKYTGFMSNRGRQNVASYLCNELNIDWRYGAAYFEQQLVDYEVCSNWGNWAYLAGVGNDPRPHRFFNTEKQAAQYDSDHQFRDLWLAKK